MNNWNVSKYLSEYSIVMLEMSSLGCLNFDHSLYSMLLLSIMASIILGRKDEQNLKELKCKQRFRKKYRCYDLSFIPH